MLAAEMNFTVDEAHLVWDRELVRVRSVTGERLLTCARYIGVRGRSCRPIPEGKESLLISCNTTRDGQRSSHDNVRRPSPLPPPPTDKENVRGNNGIVSAPHPPCPKENAQDRVAQKSLLRANGNRKSRSLSSEEVDIVT